MIKRSIKQMMAMLGMTILLSPAAYAAKPDKIDVCHVPKSNPKNLHIINIKGNALNAHLSHGDWEATAETCDAIADNNCDGEPDPVADDADCVAINGGLGWTCQIGICNSPPTDIALDSADIDENLASGTTVGMLSSIDPDSPGPFTYTFASGTGDSDNPSFSISGSQLLSTATFDFESTTSYSIRLMTDAGDGGTYQKAITISVNDINEAPTVIALDNSSIHENQATGSLIGYFTTTDVDAGDSHDYTLVEGLGDTDNASFGIVDDQLVSAESFDFETLNTYSVRVQSEDIGGLTVTRSYTITINDVNDAPTAIALDNSDVDEEQAVGTVVGTFTSTDVDSSSFEYSLVTGVGDADNASFTIADDQLQSAAIFNYDEQNSFNIRVQTDDGDGGTFQDTFTITVISICGGSCFPNGVASGDVDQSSVVLWARAAFTGMVQFEYGTDPDFIQDPDGVEEVDVEYFGEYTIIDDEFKENFSDNSPPAKVEITGLLPGTKYYYRACRDSCSSDIAPESEARGRFRTPHADGNNGLRFGVSSCFRSDLMPFVSIKNIPDRDLDFFVALGDTTYADSNKNGDRASTNDDVDDIDEFRNKNELVYREKETQDDNFFAKVRASSAIYATIDDHEVVDNFSGGATPKSQVDTVQCDATIQGHEPRGLCFCDSDNDVNPYDPGDPEYDPNWVPNCDREFINETDLYKDAMQAFHEYNPIVEEKYGVTGDARTANKNKLYRYRTFGNDAAMFMLDTRSFRDENVKILDQDLVTLPPQAYLPGRTLLGKKQLNDLLRDLRKADSDGITWKFVMVPEPIQHLGVFAAADRFEGFAHERAIILDMIETECIDNVVFISGDIHGSIVNNLTYQNPADVILGLGGHSNLQRFSYSWDISTGPVAFSPPMGVIVTSSEPEGAREFNDSIFKDVMDTQLRLLNRPRTGLDLDIFLIPPLQQRNKNIPATLIDDNDPVTLVNDPPYVSGHSYGWTEFEINPTSQKLTVTTWGIPWYKAGPVSTKEPSIINKFEVEPFIPKDAGTRCLFDTQCTSCRCATLSNQGFLMCAAKLGTSSLCLVDSQCDSGRCAGVPLTCQDKLPNGSSCVFDVDCSSSRCVGIPPFAACQEKLPTGASCIFNVDCSSGSCTTRFRPLRRTCD